MITYDTAQSKLISADNLGADIDIAQERLGAQEALFASQPQVKVLLAGSDSLETLKKTHSTFFPDQHERLNREFEQLLALAQQGEAS